jgi:hypothetical protein
MASDSNKLEELLRENLKLRRELGAEIAKAKGGSKSQRVTRGFHWLGLFLAASLFVIGLAFVVSNIMGVVGLYSPQTLIMRAAIGFVGLCWVCLTVYGVIRAIGWVIGGFAAS